MNPFSSELLVGLLAGHAIGDFVLQTDHMVANKRRPSVLLGHCMVVAAVTYLCIGRWAAWLPPLIVLVGHAMIDGVKTYFARNHLRTFLIDQLAHVALLFAIATYVVVPDSGSEWSRLFGPTATSWAIILTGAIVCIRVGGLLIGYWVQPYLEEIRRAGDALPNDVKPPRSRGLTNGGRLIGQWERALIFLFVGLGQFGAIGFLVAAKSIFRFGELKERENRMEAEYITIGTLMSFGWAILTAWLTWWLAR